MTYSQYQDLSGYQGVSEEDEQILRTFERIMIHLKHNQLMLPVIKKVSWNKPTFCS